MLSTCFIIRTLIVSCQTLILVCFSKVRGTSSLIYCQHHPRTVDHRCWLESQRLSHPVSPVLLPHDILPFSRPKRWLGQRSQSTFGLPTSVQFWTDILLKPIMVWVHQANAKMRWGYISKSDLHKFVGGVFYSVSHFTRNLSLVYSLVTSNLAEESELWI